MTILFFLLFIISFILLVAGLIRPSELNQLFKKELSRKKILMIFGGGMVLFFFAIGITAPQVEKSVEQTSNVVSQKNIIKERPVENETVEQMSDEQENKIENLAFSTTTQESAQSALQPNADPLPQETEPSAEIKSTEQATSKEENNEFQFYPVVSVVDGDTIKVNIDGITETLRLIGMDTPETVDPRKPVQCFGVEASNKAKELLSNKKVRIEKDQSQGERDKYNRLLAYVYREDGLFYNKYMIEQGYAHEYTYDIPYKYQSEFRAAEKSARENELGLWSPDTCNGDTTTSAVVEETSTSATTNLSSSKYYTSSHYSSKYYYPESCSGWESLSEKYLKSYDSLEDLLAVYPSKTLSPQCE